MNRFVVKSIRCTFLGCRMFVKSQESQVVIDAMCKKYLL